MSQSKIISIGLPRTGNQSLKEALIVLGYSVLHNMPLRQFVKFDGCVEVEEQIFIIEKVYPGSRYIFTVRDKAEWLASCQKVYETTPKWLLQQWNKFWAKKDWGKAYDERFNEAISEVPSANLLIFNVYGNDWKPLCDFLGKPEPSVPFPKADDVLKRVIKTKDDLNFVLTFWKNEV